jgi:hypothetical protein
VVQRRTRLVVLDGDRVQVVPGGQCYDHNFRKFSQKSTFRALNLHKIKSTSSNL